MPHKVIAADGTIVDIAATRTAALRRAAHLTNTTLQLHTIQGA